MIIYPSTLTEENKSFLFKFLKGGESLNKDDGYFKTSQFIFNWFKDQLRELNHLTNEQQYGQFKRLFLEKFNWSYEYQEDLNKILDWFLEVYSNSNKEDFYKLFEKECYDKYYVNFDKFIDNICEMQEYEFEDEEDILPYIKAKNIIIEQLDILVSMENDLRKIYDNIKKSLNRPKHVSKSN